MKLNVNDPDDHKLITKFRLGPEPTDEVDDVKIYGILNILDGLVTEDQVWIANHILFTYRHYRPDDTDGDMVEIMKGQRYFSAFNDFMPIMEQTPFHRLVLFMMISIREYRTNCRPGTLEMMAELARLIIDGRDEYPIITLGVYNRYRTQAWKNVDPTVK